jgi:hypothetical protein
MTKMIEVVHPMRNPIEILSNLEILRTPILDLETLQLDGVAFGADTRAFPRHKIAEVSFSPLVHGSRSGTNIEAEYFDADGKRLSKEVVIDSVINANGMFHFKDKFGFKIADGKVVGFSLYGDQLRHFDYLKSQEDLLRAFGKPDRTRTNEAYGDLMGYDNFYYGSRKCVSWSSFDEHISLINLGDYPGNSPK